LCPKNGEIAVGTLVTRISDLIGLVENRLGDTNLPESRLGFFGLLAVLSGFGDQVRVVPAWLVDEGVSVLLAA